MRSPRRCWPCLPTPRSNLRRSARPSLARSLNGVQPRRGNSILLVAAVGLVFLAGLVVHGPVGGVLLLLVAATLVLFSRHAWPHVRREGRPLRLLIIAAVVALGVAKMAGKI